MAAAYRKRFLKALLRFSLWAVFCAMQKTVVLSTKVRIAPLPFFPTIVSIFQSPKRRLRPKTRGLCSISTRFLGCRVRSLRISAIPSSVRERVLLFLVAVSLELSAHDRFVFTDCLCNHFLRTTLLIDGRNFAASPSR